MQRAGTAPGLSRYQGDSPLATAQRTAPMYAKGEFLDLRPSAAKAPKRHALWCRRRANTCLPCDCGKEAA